MSAPARLRRVVECMGTVFSFDVRQPLVDEAVLDEAEALLRRIDATYSTYRADSEISELARGARSRAGCSPEVREVLARCEQLSRDTDGYFSMWAGGALDPSGLVKGWAIERASDLLAAAGSTNHCVNGGGDVQCRGDAAPGQPWRIGIAHPLRRGELAAVVLSSGLAVATSGTAERGAHVLDPHTGTPPGGLASVTVVGSRLSDVDAYATAAFARGRGARAWLESRDGYHGFGVDEDGTSWHTSGWLSAVPSA